MADELKIACIGAGSSGAGHIVLLEQYEPGCVVAFCDIDRTRFDKIIGGYLAGSAAAESGDFRTDGVSLRADLADIPFYTDPDEMLDKADIDTVIIASWCSTHYEMVEKCARRNLNILLEKPIAITGTDVDKCWALLKDYPKVATVNFTMRGAPATLAAAGHIRAGTIGDVVSVQYVNNVHYGDGYFRSWMRTREKIGSLLLQKATHDFDVINTIIGRTPVSVAAFGSRLVYGGDMPNDLTCDVCDRKDTCPMSVYRLQQEGARPMSSGKGEKCVYASEIDIDDNHTVIINYEGGVTASYSQSFCAPQRGGRRGGFFIGTAGTMELQYYGEFVETPEGEALVGNSRIDIMQRLAKSESSIREVYDWTGESHFGGTKPGMRAKLDLLHSRPTDVENTIREGYISTKMCIAAEESIETGRVVELDLDL
jgi:predicted dehydrogenase